MTDAEHPLVPLYALERVTTDPFLTTELGMLAKRKEIEIGTMRDRAGDLRALDVDTVQRLINKGTITLRAPDDDVAWSFVGGYDAFMQKYGLRPKA